MDTVRNAVILRRLSGPPNILLQSKLVFKTVLSGRIQSKTLWYVKWKTKPLVDTRREAWEMFPDYSPTNSFSFLTGDLNRALLDSLKASILSQQLSNYSRHQNDQEGLLESRWLTSTSVWKVRVGRPENVHFLQVFQVMLIVLGPVTTLSEPWPYHLFNTFA